jgi:hypothetical protein
MSKYTIQYRLIMGAKEIEAMTGTVVVSMNCVPAAKVERLGTTGIRKAGEAWPRKAMADAGSDSRIDIARRSEAMADKAGLQTIGLLLLLATLFVLGAGAFALRHQPAADLLQGRAGFPNAKTESLTAAVP